MMTFIYLELYQWWLQGLGKNVLVDPGQVHSHKYCQGVKFLSNTHQEASWEYQVEVQNQLPMGHNKSKCYNWFVKLFGNEYTNQCIRWQWFGNDFFDNDKNLGLFKIRLIL